jgi:hypothetical protein
MTGKTVIIGASADTSRYAYKAAVMLHQAGIPFEPVGTKQGEVFGKTIHNDRPLFEGVDTVTLYVGPANQEAWKSYIFDLKPRRIIFNPGTESNLIEEATQRGIHAEVACTLVLLSTGQYFS